MADEIAALVTKFNELKNSGNKAYLWLECQDGRSFVTLQVHLQPCEEPQHPHLRRGEAHHVCRGHVQSSRARKAAPSRLRRRELRAAERAACARAACLKIPPSPPHHAPHDISPSPNQQVVDQAAAPEPAHGQGGVPHAHPVPVPCGQQSRHPPPPLPAGNHHPALLPYQEHVPVTGQQAQHSSPPPLREQEHFPPVVPTWPSHYQTSDMAFTSPNPAFPLIPPALYQVEKVSEQAVPLPPPQPGAVRAAQETDGSVLQLHTHHEHVMRSFCFLSPKDSSLLPLPPALKVRRAHPPPPRRRILRNSLVRMKPARISLNQTIDKGVKRFYISGVWVGHVCKFMHFVNSSDDVFRAEPTLVYKDPGPLPPLGPLGSQQVTDRPPHPEDADEYLG